MKNVGIASIVYLLVLGFTAVEVLAQVNTATPATVEKVDTLPQKQRSNEAILSLSYANGGMNFGLLYKMQLGKRTYFRLALADISFSSEKYRPTQSTTFPRSSQGGSVALNGGVEFRFKLHRLVQTYTGVDLIVGFDISRQKTDNPSLPASQKSDVDWTMKTGLGFSSGIVVQALPNFLIGVNLAPSITYQYRPYDYYDNDGVLTEDGAYHWLNTSFSLSSVQLFFIYRWDRKPKKAGKQQIAE